MKIKVLVMMTASIGLFNGCSLSRGCNGDLREIQYSLKCVTSNRETSGVTSSEPTDSPFSFERKSSRPLQMPLEPFDIPAGLKKGSDEKESKSNSDPIHVTGKSFDLISLASTNNGETFTSTLRGEFQVTAIDPVTNRDALQFDSATHVHVMSVNLEKCDVTELSFKTSGDTVAFEIVGKELASNLQPASCLAGFATMIRDGFTVEFLNVRAKGAALETVIPTVILRVEAAAGGSQNPN